MSNKNIEEILKNIGNETVPAEVHKIAEQVSRDFSKTLTQPEQPQHYILGEYIMKSRFTKLAVAAAVIIVVVLVGMPFVGNKGQAIALADVLAKVEQARAFFYRIKMHMKGQMQNMPADNLNMDMQGAILTSNEYGMKMDMNMIDPNTGKKTTQQMYILPCQKVAFMIMPETKKYVRMEFTDDLFARVKKQNNDPRIMVKQIMGCKYEELGRNVIDGIEVEGFRTTDPAYMGGAMGTGDVDIRLWVDTKSWLPVLVEMDIKAGEQIQMQSTMYDFQWDIPVNASEFTPVIPEDFTAFPTGGMKLPEMSEQAAIEGLRFFAELFGQYPKNLNMINLMQEFAKLMQELQEFANKLKDSNSPAIEQLRLKFKKFKEAGSEEEQANKIMEVMRPIQSLSMFYMTLVQDRKEPAYYGETVTPADTNKVLLRWKISDNEYRVIFGDLRVETVTPEKLAELESSLPK